MALYDPTTTVDLQDFLAWARSKDPEEQYCFENAGNCAVAQYGKEVGRDDLVGLDGLEPVFANPGEVIVALALEPRTYGDLADRIGRLLGDTQ